MLDNTSDQASKFTTKNWIEISDQSRGFYDTNNDIRFKTAILKYSICDYIDACILIKGRITITGSGDGAWQADERNKGVIIKNVLHFFNFKSERNNIGMDNAKDIDIVVQCIISHNINYARTSERLW